MLRYLKLTIELNETSTIPQVFMGSALRGVFGRALKKVVCINPSFLCNNCFDSKNCLYFDFFEEKNKAHQYRFSKGLNEKDFNFSFFLFEDACEKLPFVIKAFFEMFTNIGLGVNREKFGIKKISCNNEEIYKNNEFNLQKAQILEFSPNISSQNIIVFLKTPLRIKKDGRLLSTYPMLTDLVRSIHKRYCEIKSLFLTKLTFEPICQKNKSSVIFKDLTRYSNRQQSKMNLGGLMGFIEYTGIDEKSLIYLQLGEIIGLGKQTVFGLGEIIVRENDSF